MVRRCTGRADRGAGAGVGGHRAGRERARDRADGLGQDAGGVPVGHRRPHGREGARSRGGGEVGPGRARAVCVAFEGPRRRRGPQLARAPCGHSGAGGGPGAAGGREGARDPHGHAHGRHHARRAPQDRAQSAGHPHHHARVALPHAHLGGARGAAKRGDGRRGRGARAGRRQAWSPFVTVAGAARRSVGSTRPAHRPVGYGAAARCGGALPRRRAPGDGGSPGGAPGAGSGGARARAGHDGGSRVRGLLRCGRRNARAGRRPPESGRRERMEVGSGDAGRHGRRVGGGPEGGTSPRQSPGHGIHLAAHRGGHPRRGARPYLHHRVRELAGPVREADSAPERAVCQADRPGRAPRGVGGLLERCGQRRRRQWRRGRGVPAGGRHLARGGRGDRCHACARTSASPRRS